MPRKAMLNTARRPVQQRQRVTPPTNGSPLAVQALEVVARHDDLLLQTQIGMLSSLPDATHAGAVIKDFALIKVLFPCSKQEAEHAAEQELLKEIMSWGHDEDAAWELMAGQAAGEVYADIEVDGPRPWERPYANGRCIALQGSMPCDTLVSPSDRTSLAVAVRSCPAPTQALKQSAHLRSSKLPGNFRVFVTVWRHEVGEDFDDERFVVATKAHRSLLDTAKCLAGTVEDESGCRPTLHELLGPNTDTAHATFLVLQCGPSATYYYTVRGYHVQTP